MLLSFSCNRKAIAIAPAAAAELELELKLKLTFYNDESVRMVLKLMAVAMGVRVVWLLYCKQE